MLIQWNKNNLNVALKIEVNELIAQKMITPIYELDLYNALENIHIGTKNTQIPTPLLKFYNTTPNLQLSYLTISPNTLSFIIHKLLTYLSNQGDMQCSILYENLVKNGFWSVYNNPLLHNYLIEYLKIVFEKAYLDYNKTLKHLQRNKTILLNL